jgi:hypothetical protein
MPWMESSVTEERLRFVARLLEGVEVLSGSKSPAPLPSES